MAIDLSALGDSSIEVPSFQLTLGCVKLTKTKQNKKKNKKLISTPSPKPEQCVLRTSAPLWLGFNSFALLPDSFEPLSLSGLSQFSALQRRLRSCFGKGGSINNPWASLRLWVRKLEPLIYHGFLSRDVKEVTPALPPITLWLVSVTFFLIWSLAG